MEVGLRGRELRWPGSRGSRTGSSGSGSKSRDGVAVEVGLRGTGSRGSRRRR